MKKNRRRKTKITGREITRKVIETGVSPGLYEMEFVHKDGRKILLEIDESPICDKDGVVIALSGAARDITEQKETENTLRKELSISQVF